MGDFYLSLDKDPQQEEFLQGRMQGNPYPSTTSGLGPLMRDVKNKICTGKGKSLDTSGHYIGSCAVKVPAVSLSVLQLAFQPQTVNFSPPRIRTEWV